MAGRGTQCALIPSLGQTRPGSLYPPFVQLGLTPLGLCHDGVDAGIVFELLEPIQIVCVDGFSTNPASWIACQASS